ISYVDSAHHYQYNNEEYGAWFGEDPESMRGRHVRALLGPGAYRTALPYIKRALSGETVRFEDRLVSPAGGRWVHAEYIPHRVGGRVVGFVELVTDITE